MLDGRGPYTFVLDSGGDYIVTPEVAAAVQAKSSGALRLQGVGSATEGAAFTHIDSIAIGGAVVRNQYMLVLPIATGFGVAEGMKIDGMVGYQFLARFLTTIDYANSDVDARGAERVAGVRARRRCDRLLLSTARYRAFPSPSMGLRRRPKSIPEIAPASSSRRRF